MTSGMATGAGAAWWTRRVAGWTAAVAAAGAVALALPAVASAATGALTFRGCLGSNSDVDCVTIPDPQPGGANTGLTLLRSVAVSPDGKSVYTASQGDAVARFGRDPATGSLAYRGCITSDSEVECAKIPGAENGGTDTPLEGLSSVTVSADGRSVYTGSNFGDAVARFDRDPADGALTYQGCISSDTNLVDRCTLIPGSTIGGVGTGLDGLTSVAVSANSRSVYTASLFADAVARFDRDATSGELAYEGCITSNSDVQAGGCTQIPDAQPGGTNTGLNALRSIVVSPEGENVYTGSQSGDAIGRFDRNPATGALAYQGCITSDSDVSGCTEIPTAQPGGTNTGLHGLRSVAVSADGRSAYTGSASGDGEDDDAIARFDRNPATGALAYQECVTSDSDVDCAKIPGAGGGADTDLRGLSSVAVSVDGASVYTATASGDAVARFDRNPTSGALAFAGCISSDTILVGRCTLIPGATIGGLGTGLDGLTSVTVSADGRSVYTAAFGAGAIARFDRELPAGQPPALEPPSNQFSFGKLRKRKRKGIAVLTVRLPGPGELALARTKKLKRAAKQPQAAGNAKLKLRPRGKAKRKLSKRWLKQRLRRNGKAKLKAGVRAKVTYTPTGGEPRTKQRKLKLVRKGKRGKG